MPLTNKLAVSSSSLAEDLKKKRQQKDLLVALEREAKERELAERRAQMDIERTKRRIKRQEVAEQRDSALKEIQKNDVASTTEQMEPHGSFTATEKQSPSPKYKFEMLQEDDSTDEEDKVSFKRPPPPNWSLSDVRASAIKAQQYWPPSVIDTFFSVKPMTPNLKEIFPDIDKDQLKRNSSAMWSTPPGYPSFSK